MSRQDVFALAAFARTLVSAVYAVRRLPFDFQDSTATYDSVNILSNECFSTTYLPVASPDALLDTRLSKGM